MQNLKPQTPVVENISCILPQGNKIGGLFLGNVYGAQNPEILKEYGIRAVITASAQTNIEYNKEDIPFHLRIDAHDKVDYYIAEHINQCIQFIQKFRKITNVYVHCYAGVSRSSAIIVSYLISKFNWKLEKALAFVQYKRIVAKPNEGFMTQLRQFQAQHLKLHNNTDARTKPELQFRKKQDRPLAFQQQRRMNSVVQTKLLNGPSPLIHRIDGMQQPNTNIRHTYNLVNPGPPVYNHQLQYQAPQPQPQPHIFHPPQPMIIPSKVLTQTRSISQNQMVPQPKFYQHGQITLPKVLTRRSQKDTNQSKMASTQFSQVGPTSPRHKMFQRTTQANNFVKASSSIYQSRDSYQLEQQKSKTTSRCVVRPKDLPGYRNY